MIKKVGDWKKLNRALNVPLMTKTIDKFASIGTKRAGLLVVRNIRKRMRSVSSPPNSPITKMRKGSSKPWIDEGDLFRSVRSVMIAPLAVWVGIPEGVTSKDSGISLARIARILEGGAVGETPKATIIERKNARALFIPLRKGVKPKDGGLKHGVDFVLAVRVRIEPRPVIGPAVQESRPALLKIYEESVAAGFRSLMGKK